MGGKGTPDRISYYDGLDSDVFKMAPLELDNAVVMATGGVNIAATVDHRSPGDRHVFLRTWDEFVG